MRIVLIALCISVAFTACKTDTNAKPDHGTLTDNIYYNKEIGWTMSTPAGWDITQKDVVEKRTEDGFKAVKEAIGDEINYSGLKHLIAFQKDRFHIFQSTAEPFKLAYEGEWEDNNTAIKALLYNTYTERGIKVDTASTTETIDALEFKVFRITLYNEDDKVLLNQILYARHINGYDFGVNINYINDQEKNEMMSVWKNSKFN